MSSKVRTHKKKVDASRSSMGAEGVAAMNNQRRRENRVRLREYLQSEAGLAKQAREKLTPQEQLQRLDWRLGKGQGAKKERKRLLQQISEQNKLKIKLQLS